MSIVQSAIEFCGTVWNALFTSFGENSIVSIVLVISGIGVAISVFWAVFRGFAGRKNSSDDD